MSCDILKRLDDETEEEALYRIGNAKANGLLDATWVDIAQYMNKTFRDSEEDYYDESAYRKRYKNYSDARAMFDRNTSKENGTLDEYKEQIRELKKERIKLRDERTDYQKSIREEARKETFIEVVKRAFATQVEPFEYNYNNINIDNDDDMVVVLSDLHAGIEVDNYWNKFNTSILKQRLHNYLNQIIFAQNIHQCKYCNVVLGGDNISGTIHSNLRLQNNENVIEQVKIAIVYIAEFINELQKHFEKTFVYSVSGNHSRVTANKNDHLTGEELDAMIPFCLNLQFTNFKNVVIEEESPIDNTISGFITRGNKLFYVVHGDKDAPSNVLKNLTLMTGEKPDGIILGHRHHNSLDSQHGVKIIQSGSVVGTDMYCVDKRISGDPEQVFFITNSKQAVKCLYDVNLNNI